MPEISEEEHREYIDLKRKEEERQLRIKAMMERGPSVMKEFRQDLNTIRGHASVFANVLDKERVKRGYPVEYVLDRWSVVKTYLPGHLFCIKKGKPNIKHTFRKHLKDFGWKFKINYKHGLFIVTKI